MAVQLRQSNAWNKRQGFYDGQGKLVNWVERVSSTKEIAHLYNTGVAHYEDLDEDDRLRFNMLQAQRFAALELLLDLDRHDSIKPEVVDFVNDALRQDLFNSGVKMWWEEWGHNIYASDFRDHVSGLLRSPEAAPRS